MKKELLAAHFFKFALCKNEIPFCIKHIHADILSLYDTGWKVIYLSKSGYMYFYNYAFKRNNLRCDEENGAVSLVGEHSSLNRKSDQFVDYYGLNNRRKKHLLFQKGK